MNPLNKIEAACKVIRETIAFSDLSDERGIADMIAKVRVELEELDKSVYLAKRRMASREIKRFFQFQDKDEGLVGLNMFRIMYTRGNTVTMSDGQTFTLPQEAMDELGTHLFADQVAPGNGGAANGK